MDKSQFFNRLLETLREECRQAIEASKDAAEYATNEESKAESQWDTQGLEASYLAAGQAGQARQWAETIETLQSEREALLRPNQSIALGALFSCEMGGSVEWFFFAGVAGGQVIRTERAEVTVITARSPLVHRLSQLRAGALFRLPNGDSGRVLTVE